MKQERKVILNTGFQQAIHTSGAVIESGLYENTKHNTVKQLKPKS